MSRISSSVGLVTGIPIEETVKKLMEVASQPRTLLANRNTGLKQQQGALDTIGSRLLAFQFSVNKLKATSLYQTREAVSSKPEALAVSLPASGTASVGTFLAKPVRAASAQQLVSQQFANVEEALGEGSLSFRFGGFVDAGRKLEELNGGAGVPRGKIKLTDRSGQTTTIDLTAARTVDDVIAAINSSDGVAISAATNGDSFTLTDNSGGSGNLIVQDVGNGATAAALGLAGTNVASSQVTGADVLRLHAGTKLAALNDGNGVQTTKAGVADLEIQLADGSEVAVDFDNPATLGDVVAKINSVSPSKVTAAISADGRRLQLTDLTTGSGTFSVASGAASTAAEDLGIAGEADGATLTGDRILSGLRDSLLSRFRGGQGVGTLGVITVVDRSGVASAVDLSTAETLDDVINLFNAATSNVTASINEAHDGLLITDSSGGNGAFTIADADATKSAEALGIAVSDAVESVDSGALQRQTLSTATLLSSLNGGKGATLGDIRITNSNGQTKTADLNSLGSEAKTVGDVVAAINGLNHGVTARINGAGDGILLTDTLHGSSALGVTDVSGQIAKSLNLTRASKTIDVDGTPSQVIDGTTSFNVDLSDLDISNSSISLASLNNGAGVAAGDIVIADSKGKSLAVDLNGADAGITTVGQLIDAINAKATAGGVGVTARVNDAGTGLYLQDTAKGSGKLTVRDVNSNAAANLKILGEAKTVGGKQVIDGAGTFSTSTATQTGLNALAAHINGLEAGVTASAVFDGVGYRLSLSVNATGEANKLLVSSGGSGLDFEEISAAQDALLQIGSFANPAAGVLLSSADGKFAGAVGGVDLAVTSASETPVSISVTQTTADFVDSVQDIVDSYNSLRTDLGKLTAFDSEALTTGLLFGTNEALQVDSRLSQALTNRYSGFGNLDSLQKLGISIGEDGKLSLNATKLQAAFDADPEGVEEFLTKPETGVVAKLNAVVDRLAGADDSLFANRSDSLQAIITANTERLEKFDSQLDRQQERLLNQFYQLESVIAKMQSSLTSIQNLQVISPLK